MQNIKVEKNYAKDIPMINVDEEQILQVFLNIILNAIQAMPAGGFLLIKSEKINSDIIVNIEDSGTGIPESARDKIFEPFFTTKSKGTGLGLSISKRIIELHSGEIKVESIPKKGTTFTIILPVNVKLKNLIERVLILNGTKEITPEILPDEIKQNICVCKSEGIEISIPDEGIKFEEVEKNIIITALKKSNWNETKAAKLIGLTRDTLRYRIEKFGINID